jgi:GH15 family glucan-1,4-alpha-glucosidase
MAKYQRIEDYGVIGNLRSAALVSHTGSMDWCCLPHFDSPSVFARILDAQKGGYFQIAPEESAHTDQAYEGDTHILVTRFRTETGEVELADFMPPFAEARRATHHPEIHRRVRGKSGRVPLLLHFFPRPDYARAEPEIHQDTRGVLIRARNFSIALASPFPLEASGALLQARFTVEPGQTLWFVLRSCQDLACTQDLLPLDAYRSEEQYQKTRDFWLRWVERGSYPERWREMVVRSALLIKLLTFSPTGALIAAPTTSLPETLGGERNWDYRYTWLRDSALALGALLRLGYAEEAYAFFHWLEQRCVEGALQVMYRIDGGGEITEESLLHLEGYRGSRPVRMGNAAFRQLQLDVYGEVLDAFSCLNQRGRKVRGKLWAALRQLLDDIGEKWKDTDEGIWEVRGGRKPFVHSKLMCWVAMDRGIDLLDPLGTGPSFLCSLREGLRQMFTRRRAVIDGWQEVKEEIKKDLLHRGWHPQRRAFTQYYGGTELDATALLIPAYQFLPPQDERVENTLALVRQELFHDGLVYRYRGADGLVGTEGAFILCSFWLVDALALAGQKQEAAVLFEKILARANHLGLYSEEIDPESGEFRGNFPQALTHLGLINSALLLNRLLTEDPG